LSTRGTEGGRVSDPRVTALARLAARPVAEMLEKPLSR